MSYKKKRNKSHFMLPVEKKGLCGRAEAKEINDVEDTGIVNKHVAQN